MEVARGPLKSWCLVCQCRQGEPCLVQGPRGPWGVCSVWLLCLSDFSSRPIAALIPCILSGTGCWHTDWLLLCEVSFS